jgi:hypothetical protein
MVKWVRVDDNPDEPIRINLVVDRKKHPKIAQWYTNIQYGKASDEIRKALEFYIDHGQGGVSLPPPTPASAPAVVAEKPAAPAPVESVVPASTPPTGGGKISEGAAAVIDDLEGRF